MNAGVPALLAAGTALMAMAIFGRFTAAAPVPGAGVPALPFDEYPTVVPVDWRETAVPWPSLVEGSARCDAPARIDLADALGAVPSAWSVAILQQAYESEPDPAVRSAIAAALSSSQSLVT